MGMWPTQQAYWSTSMASKNLDTSMTSWLLLVAFSITAPALPACRGRLLHAAHLLRPPPTSRQASSPLVGTAGWPGQPSSIRAGTRTSRVARWPGEGPSLVGPTPGLDTAGRYQAVPPSSVISWPEPAVPRSTLRRAEEGWKTHVASVCFECYRSFRGML
jgi:hypothetical protein